MSEATFGEDDEQQVGHETKRNERHIKLCPAAMHPPNKGARSTRRWFELQSNKIIYYAKKNEKGQGATGSEKGVIGLFTDTKVTITSEGASHTAALTITNPDRTWVLVIDEKQYGKGGDTKVKANAAVSEWCSHISDLATGSTDQGIAVLVADFTSSSIGAEGGGAAAEEPKGFNARSKTAHSFYGFDKDAKKAKKKAKAGMKKDGTTNFKIELSRDSHEVSWGIGVGENAARQHVITTVVEGSASDGKLKRGDVVLLMDGKAATTLDHEDIMIFLRSTATKLKLSIKRPPVPWENSDYEDSEEEEEYGF
eukprot:gene4901-32097_t